MIHLMTCLFALITVTIGVWGFGGWSAQTAGSAQVVFWMCLGVFLMLVAAVAFSPRPKLWRRPPRR